MNPLTEAIRIVYECHTTFTSIETKVSSSAHQAELCAAAVGEARKEYARWCLELRNENLER